MVAEPRNGLFTCHAKPAEFHIVGQTPTPQGVEAILQVRCQYEGCPLHKGIADSESQIAMKWNQAVKSLVVYLGWERVKREKGIRG